LVSAAWTDGSIGAISMGNLNTGELKAFYSGNTDKVSYVEREKYPWIERFALAPSKTASEMPFYISILTLVLFQLVQISSEEGLNAYGAVTWGQFFIYQGLTKIVDGCIPLQIDVSDMYEKIVIKMRSFFMNMTVNYTLLKKTSL
jgi:hypothetical protein